MFNNGSQNGARVQGLDYCASIAQEHASGDLSEKDKVTQLTRGHSTGKLRKKASED